MTQFSETTKIALVGANSTGKTLQIRSLIEKYGADNVGIASCEHGLSTIGSSVRPDMVKDCTGLNDLKNAWKWAADKFKSRDQWMCVDGGTRALQWIAGEVWAGTDAIYTLMATEVPRDEWKKDLKPYLRYITDKGAIDGQRQWIDIGRAIEFELNRWAKLPCSIYWTFWEDLTSKGQYEKSKPWQADAPGKAGRDAIYGTFDVVLRLTVQGENIVATHDREKREFRSKVREDWDAGVKVPGEIVGFNLAAFIQTLRPQVAAIQEAK